MKIVTWNVAGLRACIRNGFNNFLTEENPDIICLQEIKMFSWQLPIKFKDYHCYWNSADKAGYSGTAIFSKEEPVAVHQNLLTEEHAAEGRVLTAEYRNFYLVTVYTPNSKAELARIDYRIEWENAFREYICQLKESKQVIICGDLNVALSPKDVYNAPIHEGSAGYSKPERALFGLLLSNGFVDAFRYNEPDTADVYSYWSYMFKAKELNRGWRLDYFLVTEPFLETIIGLNYLKEISGSDHCPVRLELADNEGVLSEA